MNIYMHVDGSELDEIDETIFDSISKWVRSSKLESTMVNNHDPDSDDFDCADLEAGINVTIKKQFDLKEPLNFLYKIAKEHKINFVVGLYNESGQKEDVCYFGHEEGKPDLYEIYTYLNL